MADLTAWVWVMDCPTTERNPSLASMAAAISLGCLLYTSYFVVPIVGALFIDFINIFIIFGFIGFLQ